MADMYAVPGEVLTAIANAIRLQTDSAAAIELKDMPLAISLISGGGGDSGESNIRFGEFTLEETLANQNSTIDIEHNCGWKPDLIFVYCENNITETYTLLATLYYVNATKWRGGYYNYNISHANSTTTTSVGASTLASGAIKSNNETTFTLAGTPNYKWVPETYRWVAIKLPD